MTIGERLKIARKARGYTQDSLAEALGMSRGVITNIEYGGLSPRHWLSRLFAISCISARPG